MIPAPVPAPAAAGDVVPIRYSFSVTDTARKLLTAGQVRGGLFIEMQSDPDNTLDILIDAQEAMDKPLQLAPADVRVLDLPAEVFPPGHARKRSFAFDMWAKLAGTRTAWRWAIGREIKEARVLELRRPRWRNLPGG